MRVVVMGDAPTFPYGMPQLKAWKLGLCRLNGKVLRSCTGQWYQTTIVFEKLVT